MRSPITRLMPFFEGPRGESGDVTLEEPLRHADKGLLHQEQNTKRMHS